MREFENNIMPPDWELRPVKYVFNVLNGATPSSNEQTYWGGDIYWATPEDIGALSGKFLEDTRRKITEQGYRNCGTQLAPVGSIIMTTRAPVGNLAIANVPLCTNQGCRSLVLKTKDDDPRFFYYQFIARKKHLEIEATGTTFLELGSDDLKSFSLWYPSPSLQRAIADYLDHQTAQIDALIHAKERLLELLSEKRRAVVTHAVTKGMNQSAPMRETLVEWLGQVPAYWKIESARWLFTEIDERSMSGNEELLSVSHLTGITPRSEKDVNMFMAESNEGYKICQPGDLVINTLWAWMGAMGVSSLHGIVSPAYNVYRPSRQLEPCYIDYLVRIPVFANEVTRYSKGVWSSRLRLYPEGFFQVIFPVPSLDEQKAIVEHLDNVVGKIDDLSKASQKTIRLLHERRLALIAAVVSGKIDITG
jgi:type I restriction enzyme, S subunit